MTNEHYSGFGPPTRDLDDYKVDGKPLDLHREIRLPRAEVIAFTAPRVYLAGPIKGLPYDAAVTWREVAAEKLAPEIVAYSPMRGKDFLDNGEALGAFYTDHVMTTPQAIMTRDHNDVMRADLVIAYLLGVESVSVGTVMEIAWSYAYRKPLVVVDVEGSPHHHPMIEQAIAYKVYSLDDAIRVARSVLLP